MVEEKRGQEAGTERLKNQRINQQVVKLLQQKTIPLNKVRYLRLQTIARQATTNASAPHLALAPPRLSPPRLAFSSPRHALSPPLPAFPAARSSRGQALPTADLLINRLKNLKDLKHSSQLLLRDEQAGRCWEALRASIIESEHSGRCVNLANNDWQKTVKMGSEGGRRRRENLLQLAEKAERHLRVKKRELRERHCQQEQYQRSRRKGASKPTQIQALLSSLRQLKQQGSSEQQLQLELLRDIRETMLEEKINRIKKDINHKKIVQLR